MKILSHVLVGRLFAGLVAVALLLAGISVVSPTSAKAQGVELGALIVGALVTTSVVLALVVLDNEDDEEEPQSP